MILTIDRAEPINYSNIENSILVLTGQQKDNMLHIIKKNKKLLLESAQSSIDSVPEKYEKQFFDVHTYKLLRI